MITVDQLEVLLRTLPQYLLFGGVALYIFSWMNKKEKLGFWGEVVFVLLGVMALVITLSGMVPSPGLPGLVPEHIKKVVLILTLFMALGLLSAISITIRVMRKKASRILFFTIFIFSIVVFFQSTSISKIPFQLSQPESPIPNSIVKDSTNVQ